MTKIWAKQALTSTGWEKDILISVGSDGYITSVAPNSPLSGTQVGAVLPAPANLHSHAFQRAMAGMTEQRGDDPSDNFWTWRKLMYAFLKHLTPEDVEAIATFVQMEMLEAGYAASAEFHYIHHQTGGTPYDNVAELSHRVSAAAIESGIGLTLLPVMYEQAGCDGRPLGAGQLRFGNDIERYQQLFSAAKSGLKSLPPDTNIGVAPHSLRAVSRDSLSALPAICPEGPVHIHIAEQTAEVDEVMTAYGQRPVDWLLSHHDVNARWCLVHATQMTANETAALAKSGAAAGLCPITEANLGDGIFDGVRFLKNGGVFGIGSDSNVRISLSEELRTLEYSQRFKHLGRAVLASPGKSTGRTLLEGAARGGAQAMGRKSGIIAPGYLADITALDSGHIDLLGKSGDMLLDSYIFAGDDRMVTDVWSAGRHVVRDGAHIRRNAISTRYKTCLTSLMDRL